MAILATTHIPGGNAEQAAEWNDRVSKVLSASPGFIVQVDTPAPDGGWQILSVWESEADLQRYFESAVKPYLPPEAPMAQSIAQVHQVITPQP
jgi:heme-degrading monooxygenase HmoA